MSDMYRANYLYYDKNSPVQYSSKSKILQYLRNELKKERISRNEYKKAVNDVVKLGKKIELGTHLQHHKRKINQFHYSLYSNKDQLFQMDLMDLSSYSNYNHGYKWVLFFINAQTKFLRIRLMKNKSGKEVARSLSSIFDGMQDILKNINYRILIQCDNGKEFYNKDVENVLAKYSAVNNHNGNIEIYSTNSDHKAAIVESSIRTIRASLVRSMEDQGPKWIDQIHDVIRKYNSSYHSTIKMSPDDAEYNFLEALTNIHSKYYRDSYKKDTIRQKYRKGDIVRILAKNTHFRKGTLRKWTAEIFIIAYVRKLINKYVYKLKDRNGGIIDGTFDDNDMQLAASQTVYKFRVLKTRRRNGIKELYVQWDGFPESDNSWIKEVDIIQ